MASYTQTIQEILKQDSNADLGLSNYPIFDESYRAGLNQKIVDEYWNREISGEIYSEWRLWMRRRMNKIMPYYNQMYLSERLVIDPLHTMDMTTVSKALGDSDSTGTMAGHTASTGKSLNDATAGARSRAVNMDTPQNELSETGDYASSAQDSTSESTSNSEATNSENSTNNVDSTNKSTTSNTVDSNTKGFSGSQAVLLNEYRKTFVNIDAQIIDDLADLFMQVYSTGADVLNNYKGNGLGYVFPSTIY